MSKANLEFDTEYFRQTKDNLIEFCRGYKHIFIYGAGKYGEICLTILKEHHIHVEGFLVSEGSVSHYFGLPIYLAKEKLPEMLPETAVIFSLKKSFQEDIKRDLVNTDHIAFREIEDVFFQHYQFGIMLESLMRLNTSAPAKMPVDKPKDWRKILIVRLDAVGDMIWTTPFFRELKRNFQDSEVTLVVRKGIYSLVEHCPYIDKIILYDCDLKQSVSVSKNREKEIDSFAKRHLTKEQYDVVFLPEFLPKGPHCKLDALLALHSSARYRIARAHYIESLEKKVCLALEGLFSVVVKHDTVEHEVLRILKLLEVCDATIENDKMELWLSDSDEIFARSFVNRDKSDETIFIAVAPVSNDANRSWGASNYIELIKIISRMYGEKIKFILLGGENAAYMSDAIEATELGVDVLNLINKTTLSQAAALIKYCDMYLGANTGILHMASVFEKPVIEISAYLRGGKATARLNPERVGAWHVPNKAIQPAGLDGCQDCCQKSYAHCINQITVAEVRKELEAMIAYVLGEKGKRL